MYVCLCVCVSVGSSISQRSPRATEVSESPLAPLDSLSFQDFLLLLLSSWSSSCIYPPRYVMIRHYVTLHAVSRLMPSGLSCKRLTKLRSRFRMFNKLRILLLRKWWKLISWSRKIKRLFFFLVDIEIRMVLKQRQKTGSVGVKKRVSGK